MSAAKEMVACIDCCEQVNEKEVRCYERAMCFLYLRMLHEKRRADDAEFLLYCVGGVS